MRLLNINDKEYEFKTSIDDLTIEELYLYLEVINTKEFESKIVNDGANKIQVELDESEESWEFVIGKYRKILGILIKGLDIELSEAVAITLMGEVDIDLELVEDEIYEDFGIIQDLSIIQDSDQYNSFFFTSPSSQQSQSQSQYRILNSNELYTIQYCNFESFISYNMPFDAVSVKLVPNSNQFIYSEKYANQFVNIIKSAPAVKYFNTFVYHAFKEPNINVRNQFEYIYNKVKGKAVNSNKLSDASIEYYKKYGWEVILLELAELRYWNHPKGYLYATQYTNIIDSFSVLNIKKGKSFAENEDYHLNYK